MNPTKNEKAIEDLKAKEEESRVVKQELKYAENQKATAVKVKEKAKEDRKAEEEETRVEVAQNRKTTVEKEQEQAIVTVPTLSGQNEDEKNSPALPKISMTTDDVEDQIEKGTHSGTWYFLLRVISTNLDVSF